MILDYAVEADPANDKVVPKQGSIKVVVRQRWVESNVICEIVTQRTESNKLKIKNIEDY